MAKFKVCVWWSMSGTYDVEAETLDEACDLVLEANPPYENLPEGGYIDDSMEIDYDATYILDSSENGNG